MSKDFLAFNTDGDILSLDGKLVRKHGVVVDASMKAAIRATLGVPGAAEGLVPASNLSDVASISTSRTNLEVFSQGEVSDRTNASQPSNGVYFNGSNSYLTGAGSFSSLIGTSDFAVSWIMSYPTAANDDETIFEDGNVSLRIAGGASDYFRLRIDGTDYIIPTAIVAHDEYKHYVVDVDRSGNATLRIDGKDSGTIDVSAEVSTVITGSAYSINKTGTNGIRATIKSFVAWNRLLGSSYSVRLAANGNVPAVADQWGDNTEILANPGFETWTTASDAGSWNEGASITVAQDAVNKYSGTYACHYTGSGSPTTTGVAHQLRQSDIVPVGQNYASVIVKNAAAGVFSIGVNNDRFLTFDGTSLTDVSSEVVAQYPGSSLDKHKLTDLGSGWFKIELWFNVVSTAARDFVLGGTGQWYIDGASNKKAGAVLALQPENVQADGSIRDASSNGLHAAGTNTSPVKKLQVLEIDALSPAEDSKLLVIKVAGTTKASIDEDGDAVVNQLNISNIPTSSGGLSSGDIWSDSGTLKIVS